MISSKPTHNTQARTKSTTRRGFMKDAGGAAAAAVIASTAPARRTLGNVLGANERIALGFIGCGGRANNHMKGLSALAAKGEAIQLVAACDIYRPRLQACVEQYKLKAYRTHQELLQDKSVDAVVIATPDHQHGYQAIDAIQAGKDVYCEKPITHWRQFELTKRLAQEVAKSGRVLMVGTQFMSDGAWGPARKLIEDGTIGRVIQAECSYFRPGDWGERNMKIDDPNAKPGPDLDWEAFLGDAPKRPFDVSRFFRWRMYIDYSGGPATDLYPHVMTQVVYMMGVKFPSTVVGTGGKFRFNGERDVPDTFSMLVDYPEKLTFVFTGTQGSSYNGPQMYCLGSAPIIRGWDAVLTFRGKEIVVYRHDDKKPKEQRIPIEHGPDHDMFYREWLNGIRTRKQPTSSAQLAYYTQTVLHMAMTSWQQGKVAKFDAQNEKITLV